jgi:hypothetical protein
MAEGSLPTRKTPMTPMTVRKAKSVLRKLLSSSLYSVRMLFVVVSPFPPIDEPLLIWFSRPGAYYMHT